MISKSIFNIFTRADYVAITLQFHNICRVTNFIALKRLKCHGCIKDGPWIHGWEKKFFKQKVSTQTNLVTCVTDWHPRLIEVTKHDYPRFIWCPWLEDDIPWAPRMLNQRFWVFLFSQKVFGFNDQTSDNVVLKVNVLRQADWIRHENVLKITCRTGQISRKKLKKNWRFWKFEASNIDLIEWPRKNFYLCSLGKRTRTLCISFSCVYLINQCFETRLSGRWS